MQEQFPSNSINKRPAPSQPAPEQPKVQPIVTGTVIQRKPSLGKKFKEVFIGADPSSVLAYVSYDIVIPAIKDVVVDAFTMGLERWVFGDVRGGSPSRRARGSSSGATGHVNYGSFSKTPDRYGNVSQGRQLSQSSRASLNFDEIIIETRTEAESIIEHLTMLIDQYQVAKVADLYDLCKITNADYTVQKYGWDDLRGASVDRVRGGGYLLNLPRPIQLSD